MLQRGKWIFATLALVPILIIYTAVRLYPIGETLRLSLHRWNILSKNKPFIGLDNFRELIGDYDIAMSAVQVAALIEDEAKVEIEATAVIPD